VREEVIENQREENSLSGKSRKYMVLRAKRQIASLAEGAERGGQPELERFGCPDAFDLPRQLKNVDKIFGRVFGETKPVARKKSSRKK
jgi:hypothetical protein